MRFNPGTTMAILALKNEGFDIHFHLHNSWGLCQGRYIGGDIIMMEILRRQYKKTS